jgi:hypothetical protein
MRKLKYTNKLILKALINKLLQLINPYNIHLTVILKASSEAFKINEILSLECESLHLDHLGL